MNFRRGPSCLLRFLQRMLNSAFRKPTNLSTTSPAVSLHFLWNPTVGLFYVFRETGLVFRRLSVSRRILQPLPKFHLFRSFETCLPTVSQTPGPGSYRPSRLRRGWLESNHTLNPRKREPNNVSGVPRGEIKASGQPPRILSAEEQTQMREVCKVSSFRGPPLPPPSLILYYLARPLVKSWTSLPLT